MLQPSMISIDQLNLPLFPGIVTDQTREEMIPKSQLQQARLVNRKKLKKGKTTVQMVLFLKNWRLWILWISGGEAGHFS